MYCFTIKSPLAKTKFTLNNALPVDSLIGNASSVNIINQDKFKKLKILISVTFERSFVKIYSYGCETPLLILGRCVVGIYSNCTDERTLTIFHVIDATESCILDKSTSKLPCV